MLRFLSLLVLAGAGFAALTQLAMADDLGAPVQYDWVVITTRVVCVVQGKEVACANRWDLFVDDKCVEAPYSGDWVYVGHVHPCRKFGRWCSASAADDCFASILHVP